MERLCLLLLVALMTIAGPAAAQSSAGFTSPSTGAAAAGGSPVGTVLPYTVQSGSTAPTQPGHTITGDRLPPSGPARTSSSGGIDSRESDTGSPVAKASSK